MPQYVCAECGEPFSLPRANSRARFCCPAHRVLFDNRRKLRGAQMYDVIMAKRYQRKSEKVCLSLLDNLARAARDADKALRDGRNSWLPLELAKAAIPLAYGNEGDGR